jgi:hypothetical protein
MLGLEPHDYSQVRVEWPVSGAPAWRITEDICFLRVVEVQDDFELIRELAYPQRDAITLNRVLTYTRVWEATFAMYGPNCFDRVRMIKDAVQLDFDHDTLAASNLYLVTDMPASVYMPEEYQGNWWRRTDVKLRFNEFVTSVSQIPAMAGVDIAIELVKETLVAQ